MRKIIQNIVPRGEPVTISAREKISRSELRLSVVNRDGRKMIDLRIWDVSTDGNAVPHDGGYNLNFQEAAVLLDALNDILGREK